MTTEELTPEYIVSIKDTLTDEELIKDYGNEQGDGAIYGVGKE